MKDISIHREHYIPGPKGLEVLRVTARRIGPRHFSVGDRVDYSEIEDGVKVKPQHKLTVESVERVPNGDFPFWRVTAVGPNCRIIANQRCFVVSKK